MRRLRNVVGLTAVATITSVLIAVGGSPASTSAAPAPAPKPSATTESATSASPSSEVVHGVVNPHGLATTYFFQYGTTTKYGSHTAVTSAGNGRGGVAVSATLEGLAAKTTYHYRLVATNAGGTTLGADRAFTTAPNTSQVRVMGREGFVSPGGVIGVEVGCFVGQTNCVGHIQMTHNGTLVGQRDYAIAPESGGFQNLKLTPEGRALLRHNHVRHLLGVNVTVTDKSGQTLNYVIHLARWVWH